MVIPFDVACPVCRAEPGERCRSARATRNGEPYVRVAAHIQRWPLRQCLTCNHPIPYARGRPRLYCTECVELRLRESDNRSKYGRRSDRRRYVAAVPASAAETTDDMGVDAKAWRLARRARLEGVAEYDRRLLERKRAAGILTE